MRQTANSTLYLAMIVALIVCGCAHTKQTSQKPVAQSREEDLGVESRTHIHHSNKRQRVRGRGRGSIPHHRRAQKEADRLPHAREHSRVSLLRCSCTSRDSTASSRRGTALKLQSMKDQRPNKITGANQRKPVTVYLQFERQGRLPLVAQFGRSA